MKNGQRKSKDRAHDDNVVVSSTPTRTKASPRSSTPTHHASTSYNTLSGSPIEMDMSSDRSSGRESPLRGRLFTICPVVINNGGVTTAPVLINTNSDGHWAGPHQQQFRASENDSKRLQQQRLLSKDFTTSPEDFEAFIKEPCPAGNVVELNVAEVLSSTTPPTDRSFDFGGTFERHRDTFALRELRRQKKNSSAMNKMPDEFFRRISQYIDSETFFALRLSCRCCSAGLVASDDATTNYHHDHSSPAGRSATESSSAASFLPVEILHQIYSYLDPADFDAARRICRTWMGSSLNSRLLERMLKTAGWWNSSLADALGNEMRGLGTRIESEEWLLSKRLATEHSLRPNWGGNGLDDSRSILTPSEFRFLRDEKLSEPHGTRSFRSFTLVSEVDFSALGSLESISGDVQRVSAVLQFTTSICGRYLLVTRDRTIYVYSLRNQTCMTHEIKASCPVTLVSTVDCPNRVLAVSMDTSCGRFAVAALLEERVGLVCCLEDLGTGTRWPKNDGHAWDPVSSALWEYQALRSKSGNPLDSYHHPSSSPTTQPTSPRNIDSKGSSSSSSRSRYSPYPPSPRRGNGRGDHPSSGVEGGGGESATRANKDLPETGPYSLYHNLCSPNDPPLTVCICAQRRCVAFGCSAAIELHWVDALSGQGLNRWFPTSSWKAGVLYFFPSEREDERQQRLRVICSGLVPTTTTPPFTSTPSSVAADHNVWTTGGGEEEEGERACYCYYNAVPLSDGRHALFVDSSLRPGELCLGIEARNRRSMEIGAPYLQLKTRAVFERPTSAGPSTLPRFYAVGRDLSWGARIVVGFGDEVWLYVIAGDWLGMEVEEDEAVLQEDGEEIEDKKKKSVSRVSGIKVGEVQDLVGVGVCADNGGVLVRGISGSMCSVREWKITSSTLMSSATAAAKSLPSRKEAVNEVRLWSVRPMGGVVERIDVTEFLMRDAGTPDVEADEDEPSPVAGIGQGSRVRFDAGGDVIMPDAPPPTRTDYVNQDQQQHHQKQDQVAVKLARQYNIEANDNNDEIRIDSDGDVIMKGGESAAGFILGPEFDGMWHQVADYDEDDTFDEGYYSDSGSAGRPWAGTVAIHPACVGFVAGRDDGDDGDDDEGVDVEMVENKGGLWERSRCEVDVLGVRG